MSKVTDHFYIRRYIDRLFQLTKLRYKNEDLNTDKLYKFIEKSVDKRVTNPAIAVVNNYTNSIAKSDVLGLLEMIDKNRLIVAGAGVLYLPHDAKENPIIQFILDIMGKRKYHKKARSNYNKGSDEWFFEDLMQLLMKLLINSLYGAFGYKGFCLHNRFNAESITNGGRQIITSAAEGFENFLADNVNFATFEEMLLVLDNIHTEYVEKYKGKIDVSIFDIKNLDQLLVNRLSDKCAFEVDLETLSFIEDCVDNMDYEEKVIQYYKNNFFEFNKNTFIKEKIQYIIENIDGDEIWDLETNTDQKINTAISDMWDFYKVFVLYDYPIYDRVRKGMYIKKKAVCYVDTDSNFIPLNRFVQYVKNDVLSNTFTRDVKESEHITVSIILKMLERVVERSMQTMCEYMNIPDEYAEKLSMKNEFYMSRMIFTDAKKRYISNALFQEGQSLNDGIGLPEIKGFDFKKASIKPFVTKFYTDICLDNLLRNETIDIEEIYHKMIYLKDDIEKSMRVGESKYYKQASVQLLEHYKKPYSQSGYTGVLLWNTLCPNYRLDLPIDVDLIPIKSLTFERKVKTKEERTTQMVQPTTFDSSSIKNKNIRWFMEAYPDEFAKLHDMIYANPHPDIRHMSLNYIAKPKNTDIELPVWFSELVDTEKVVNDSLSLFYPILDSLGMTMLKTSSTQQYMSNVISL